MCGKLISTPFFAARAAVYAEFSAGKKHKSINRRPSHLPLKISLELKSKQNKIQSESETQACKTEMSSTSRYRKKQEKRHWMEVFCFGEFADKRVESANGDFLIAD